MTNLANIDVAALIDAFGGLAGMSRALGHKHPTTVQGWKESKSIPSWRNFEITAAANERGINLAQFIISPNEAAQS